MLPIWSIQSTGQVLELVRFEENCRLKIIDVINIHENIIGTDQEDKSQNNTDYSRNVGAGLHELADSNQSYFLLHLKLVSKLLSFQLLSTKSLRLGERLLLQLILLESIWL